VKDLLSLGTVVVAALLFLAFLTTLRPSAIVAVTGDKVIDVAPMKQGLADFGRLLTSRAPPKCQD